MTTLANLQDKHSNTWPPDDQLEELKHDNVPSADD